jgi:hypothetical protein
MSKGTSAGADAATAIALLNCFSPSLNVPMERQGMAFRYSFPLLATAISRVEGAGLHSHGAFVSVAQRLFSAK